MVVDDRDVVRYVKDELAKAQDAYSQAVWERALTCVRVVKAIEDQKRKEVDDGK